MSPRRFAPALLLVAACATATGTRTGQAPAPAPASSGPSDNRMGEGEQEAVWVCHGNKNPTWKKVAAPAAGGHEKHGDRVSRTPQDDGKPCT